MNRSRQRSLAVIAAVGLVGALAACSSSGGSPDAGASSAPTGSDVNVWTTYPANVNSDQIGAGVKAGVRAINADGGLAGHNVVVKECKSDLTPQGEIACFQQAVDDPDAVALISPLVITAGDDTDAIIEEAGLPAINSNPDTPAALKGAMQFPLGQNLYDQPGCAVLGGDAVGAKSITLAVSETPNAQEQAADAAALVEARGVTTETLTFPVSTTDISPYVQQAIDTDADLIMPAAPPQLMGAWITAQGRSGYEGAMCVSDGLAPYQVLAGLGPDISDIYLTGSFPEVTWDYPLLDEFNKQAQAEVDAGDALASPAPENNPNLVFRGWLGAYALAQAAENLSGDELTKEALVEALNSTTVTFGPEGDAPMPPIDFSVPNPNPDMPRQFNTGVILKKWNPETVTIDPVGDGLPVPGDEL
ncbi:ABC transporter substrate-binding protein [Herbiconiux daphne]|uniref:ABC transporter substrate-binding protein n=1 Tax=Herbiconiux daphne TaxID=2970914 RepID=A0ABT2H3P5_9MICO|nr:ABC transporter substrate-binding protein [Herbiconiux daphne]MCS5734553.1 ABC transporter substrate-binding protein [Herbiconiux daphne]